MSDEPKWTPEWELEKQMFGLDMGGNHQVSVFLKARTPDGSRRVVFGGGRLKNPLTQAILADAQLFKTAPKLYAALESVEHSMATGQWEKVEDVREQIRSVLAEARGEGGGE